jgi:hypothetical protein
MRAKQVEQLLDGLPLLRPVLVRARQLAELQRRYVEIAPARLSRSSRVASLEGTTLVIIADNGAIGAKLKLLAPTLVNGFSLNAQEVTALRIEVQANIAPISPAPRKKPLSAEARESLTTLQQNLPDGELKQALTSFISRLG